MHQRHCNMSTKGEEIGQTAETSTHSEAMDQWVQMYATPHNCRSPLQGGPIDRGRLVAAFL